MRPRVMNEQMLQRLFSCRVQYCIIGYVYLFLKDCSGLTSAQTPKLIIVSEHLYIIYISPPWNYKVLTAF